MVKVLDVDKADGRIFLVMDLLRGPSMAQVIEELRELRTRSAGASPAEGRAQVARDLEGLRARLRCLADIARALAFCHDRGVLHRDIKPSNVLFSEAGEPKLIDFGLAHIDDADDETKVDTTQSFRGTPAYFSPEQIETGRTGADPHCEIFSFGTLCYELLDPRSTPSASRRARPRSTRSCSRGPGPCASTIASLPPEVERVVNFTAWSASRQDRYPEPRRRGGGPRPLCSRTGRSRSRNPRLAARVAALGPAARAPIADRDRDCDPGRALRSCVVASLLVTASTWSAHATH